MTADRGRLGGASTAPARDAAPGRGLVAPSRRPDPMETPGYLSAAGRLAVDAGKPASTKLLRISVSTLMHAPCHSPETSAWPRWIRHRAPVTTSSPAGLSARSRHLCRGRWLQAHHRDGTTGRSGVTNRQQDPHYRLVSNDMGGAQIAAGLSGCGVHVRMRGCLQMEKGLLAGGSG